VSRESIREKAARYLGDGRLEVELVSQGRVAASCRGESGEYAIEYDPRRRSWTCSCPARKRCCHIAAAELVTRAGDE
jgi:hypothetical protein